jgi:hypothetical protein
MKKSLSLISIENSFNDMLVTRKFDGDNDEALKWQQHDCYGEASGIIAGGCLRHYESALRVTGQYTTGIAKQLEALRQSFDHRTLQDAHDFLAAWWRWRHHRHEPYLAGMEPATVQGWLMWLRHEAGGWPAHAPDVVLQVAWVLLHQNTDKGYLAEDGLQSALRLHYNGMPDASNL